jgi:hypothetical protein
MKEQGMVGVIPCSTIRNTMKKLKTKKDVIDTLEVLEAFVPNYKLNPRDEELVQTIIKKIKNWVNRQNNEEHFGKDY